MPSEEPPIWKFAIYAVLFFGIPVAVGVGIGLLGELGGLPGFWAGMLGTGIACGGLYGWLLYLGARHRQKHALNHKSEANPPAAVDRDGRDGQ